MEAAVAFALGGSVLAVSVPAFVRNLHAARITEALDGLQRQAVRADALAEVAPQESAYPESAPLTPAQVPRGELVTDPPGTWDHPSWRILDFSFSVPHAYSFEFSSQNGPAVSRFTVQARGDLDGDGVLSSLEISGELKRGGRSTTLPLEVSREVE